MIPCQNCNAELPDDARFCGSCGGAINAPADGQTKVSDARHMDASGLQAPARMSLPGIAPVSPSPAFLTGPQWNPYLEKNPNVEGDTYTTAMSEEEEEEERRRRAALFGMGLAELGAYPQGGGMPVVQGTPQMGSVPAVQGAPQVPGSAFPGGSVQVAPHTPPAYMSGPVSPAPHLPSTTSPTQTLPAHHPPSGSPGSPPRHGCAPGLIIAAITIPLVIIASIFWLGLTIFAPGLSLAGSSSVTPGGTLSLHGSHFLPGSSITLELDGTTPIFVLNQRPMQPADFATGAGQNQQAQQAARAAGLAAAQVYALASGNATISAGSDGAFNVSIPIDPSWSSGRHTISATEAITHRSASLLFTILSSTPFTPTPAGTGTVTPTPSVSATPATVTPTPTTTAPSSQPGLSCINPASVTLGPVSEYYAQVLTSTATLCANGSGPVSWSASWNTNQAPWLSLKTTSGQINAPGEVQIALSASAAQLGQGNYAATITFSSPSSRAAETLKVSFVVQAGCIKASPGTLSFTGVASASDAPAQTVALTNCGAIGTWTARATTTDGANWLYVSPASKTLDGRGAPPENVSITTSNLKTQLAPGTYTGSVNFTIGSGSFTVQVTLIVQPPPTLSVNPTALTGSVDCSASGGTYACFVTLTNNAPYANLTWTYSQKLIPSLVVKPSSFTIAPGQSARVPLYISPNDCSSGAEIIFTGPANSVNVAWQCYPPIG
jgi:zinc-ribbon domain/Viral BACON domain